MAGVLKIWALLIVALLNNILIKCEPSWTFDVVSFDIENRTPDILLVDIRITRPYRGAFGLSGICDFKKDITDKLTVRVSIYYSLTGSNYINTSFFLPESNLTTIMNVYYKDLFMESVLDCTDNAPRLEDKFVAPLTKRTIKLNNCIFSNENMPSHMKSGYYKIIQQYRNDFDADVIHIIKVEPND